jgi:hypothetical protein
MLSVRSTISHTISSRFGNCNRNCSTVNTDQLLKTPPAQARGVLGGASTLPPSLSRERKSSSCVASLRLLGRRAPARGIPMRSVQHLSLFRAFFGSLVCCLQARLRTFPIPLVPGTRGDGNGTDRDEQPETRSRGHAVPARCRTGTDASAARATL